MYFGCKRECHCPQENPKAYVGRILYAEFYDLFSNGLDREEAREDERRVMGQNVNNQELRENGKEFFELFLQLFCRNDKKKNEYRFRENIQVTVMVVLHHGITEWEGVYFFVFLKICSASNIL